MKFSGIKHKIKNLGNFKSLKEIKKAGLRIVRNTKTGDYWLIEEEFLKPIIFSLKEIKDYQVNPQELSKKVILCCKNKREIKGKRILKYINNGERVGYHKNPTCNSRSPWYCLAENWQYAPLIFPAKVGERMPVFLSNNTYEDKKLYGITPENLRDVEIIGALLNSTLMRFFIEFTCRQLTGAQAIADIDVVVVKQSMIINPEKLSISQRKKLKQYFNNLLRTKSSSIFEELGTNNPEKVSLNKIKPERREIDEIVMGEILELSDEEQLEVYQAVVDLVKSRIEKSKSVQQKRRTKKGVDIEKLITIILEKIGENTLKNFYKEKILSREDLMIKKLPEIRNKIEIKKGLFGWQVVSGKNSIECSSKSEAEYLKIWLEVGVSSIKIPRDKKYLSKIVKEFRKLKSHIDQLIENYLSSIIDKKLKSQILHKIWSEIL